MENSADNSKFADRISPDGEGRAGEELRILILEDSPYDAELMEENLKQEGIAFTARRVETAEEFSRALAGFSPGLILSDYDLPGFNGAQALKIARERRPGVPFILVTGAIGEERAIEILTSGATDYVLKDRMSRLAPAVRRSLQEVRERRERENAQLMFKMLVEQIPAVTYRLSPGPGPSFKCNYVSPQIESIIGTSPAQFLADPRMFEERIHPADRDSVLTQLKACLGGGVPFSAEYRVSHPDGRTLWLRDEAIPIRDKSGVLLHYQGILTDITRLKETEAELRRAHDTLEIRVRERTEELEAFTSSVSHDLRGPVWMLDGYIKVLMDDLEEKLDPDLRHRIGMIWKTVKNMDRLIDDLLSLSRVNRTELCMAPLDVREVVMDAWEEIRRLNPAREILFIVQDLPAAAGDRNLVRQAVYNLLSNAVKFSSKRKQARIEVGGCTDGDSSVFYIRDNGVGFDMEQHEKLFGLFQRLHGSKFEGTGVGLTIVQRIIRRHGGHVRAEGGINRGATFFFSLPGCVQAP